MADLAPAIDPALIMGPEIAWLKANPAFKERPATLEEFVGPQYLNIRKKVRKRILAELKEIIGERVTGVRPTKYELALITGGIGIGKTTVASIVLPYLVHWTLCLRDPQDFFDLLPGSRIAFMMMSTSEKQAREVCFGDVKARIENSPWFKSHPFDPTFKNQLRFENDIWIVPGDSTETAFEGYNILGGIIDEGDSHKQTKDKDYAQVGYDAISSRISSRFGNRGFLLVIGQMKKAVGFMATKFEEFRNDPKAYAVRLTIWESLGDEHYADENGIVHKFWFDPVRKQIVPDEVVAVRGAGGLLHIPELYRRQFLTHPEKALRDLAGHPPAVSDPFITLAYKITEARDRWIASHPGLPSPVTVDGKVESWFRAKETLKRVGHLDIAYAPGGDALGFAMGHVHRMVEVDDELKPYIVIDLLVRMSAPAGSAIHLATARRFIYALRDKYGFRMNKLTCDGFQSTDTQQQFERRRYEVQYVSVDREVLPYHDLREALYEDRIEFPPYLVDITDREGIPERVEILVKELTELMDTGAKVDHPVGGSKDLADAVAGVTTTLMGDRSYHRRRLDMSNMSRPRPTVPSGPMQHPAYRGDLSVVRAPLPPTRPWR